MLGAHALRVAVNVQALAEVTRSRAEWVMWLDMDLLLNNMGFELPFNSYSGYDFVAHGYMDGVMKGDSLQSMSLPSLLEVNCMS